MGNVDHDANVCDTQLIRVLRFAGKADVGQSHCSEPDCSSYSERPSHQAVAQGRQERQHREHRFYRRVQRIHLRYVN